MGRIRRIHQVKLFAGLLSADIEIFPKVKKALAGSFGAIDFESQILDFRHTDYYKEEMGENLSRQFVSFEKLIDPADAYKAKLRTNRIESLFLIEGKKRSINIDPGYLDLSKVILFSTKDYSHRIYLKAGVFAEATLFYKDKNYNPWPWTYPDYKSDGYLSIFNIIRRLYKERIA